MWWISVIELVLRTLSGLSVGVEVSLFGAELLGREGEYDLFGIELV